MNDDPYCKNRELMDKLSTIQAGDFKNNKQNFSGVKPEISNKHGQRVDIFDFMNNRHAKNRGQILDYSANVSDPKIDHQPIKNNEPAQHDLDLSLEEIFQGCTKKMDILLSNSKSGAHVKKLFTCKIPPGVLTGTKFCFNSDGVPIPQALTSNDVVFTVKELPSEHFRRLNDVDIEHIAVVKQDSNKPGLELKIPTLEHDPIVLSNDEPIVDGSVERISGRGLPYVGDKTKRGELIVRFKVGDEIQERTDDVPQPDPNQQPKPLEVTLPISLENVLNGCVREFDVKRKYFDKLGHEQIETKKLSVKIKPGLETGSRIALHWEGNQQSAGGPFSDVVATIEYEPHASFNRNGVDIHYTCSVTTKQLLRGGKISVPTLDDGDILLSIDNDNVSPGKQKRLPGKGLPYPSDSRLRGDLVVHFELAQEEEEQPKTQDPPIERELSLSLEQILCGCKKRVKVNRKITNSHGDEYDEEKILTIVVPPGTRTGTRYTFEQMGDAVGGRIPGDIVFVVVDKPHQHFTRVGADIEYVAQITQEQFLNNHRIEIPTIGTAPISFSLRKLKNASVAKRFAGYGLPHEDNTEKRGDLIVRFEIVESPKLDNKEQKQEKVQDPPIERALPIALKHVLTGHSKKIRINRLLVDCNGNKSLKDEFVTIEINRGTKPGTRFTFPKMGDHLDPSTIPADVVFITEDKRHPLFKRVNVADLEHIAKITRSEAKSGCCKIDVPTLDGEVKRLKIDEQINGDPNKFARIESYGLPFLDNIEKRGDLLVKFELVDDSCKDLPVERELPLTLEEIASGCTKDISFSRKQIAQDGSETVEEIVKSIPMSPGAATGTPIILHRYGNQVSGRIAGDLVYRIVDIPHPIFKRSGADVEYIGQIAVSEAKYESMELKVPTLDGGKLAVLFERGKSSKKFAGLGLPLPGDSNKRGDLICIFEIVSDDCKDLPIEKEVLLSLKKVMHGCSKQVKISRSIMDEAGNVNMESDTFTIEVQPGVKAGTRFLFPRRGKEQPGRIPADIVFIIRDKPHAEFTRNGADLVYHKAKISIRDAERGCMLQVPNVFQNEAFHQLKLEPGIEPNSVHRIAGQGLPLTSNPSERGDIVVHVQIIQNQLLEDNVDRSINETVESENQSVMHEESQQTIANDQSIQNAQIKPENNDNGSENATEHVTNREAFAQNEQNQRENVTWSALSSELLPGSLRKDPNVQINSASNMKFELSLTLEKVLKGSIEFVKFERQVTELNGKTRVETQEMEIKVAPGTENGMEFVFPRKGHRLPGKIPVDVIYVVKILPHAMFTPIAGPDIEYVAKLLSTEAQSGSSIQIPTLENRMINFKLSKPIKSGEVISFGGHGLPQSNSSNIRGKLFVRFEILEPKHISQIEQQRKLPANKCTLPLSLTDLLHGCIKEKEVQTKIIEPDGTVQLVSKTFPVQIKPGLESGTIFKIPESGDQEYGAVSADVIITTTDAPHELFTRDGPNLHYTCKVSSKQANSCSFRVCIPTLDNGNVPIYVDQRLFHGSTMELHGYGLPYESDEDRRGDLVIHFETIKC